MLLIHPTIQAIAILLASFAFLTGLQRFRAFHLKQKVIFPWKRHVLIGRIALALLLFGLILGFAMVRLHWGHNLMTFWPWKNGAGDNSFHPLWHPFRSCSLPQGTSPSCVEDSPRSKQHSTVNPSIHSGSVWHRSLPTFRRGIMRKRLSVLDMFYPYSMMVWE